MLETIPFALVGKMTSQECFSVTGLKVMPSTPHDAKGTLVLQMFPGIVLIIPYFNLAQRLGLYYTYAALIIANCSFVLPFSIWMLHSYLESIPVDLEDAARIDGCTRMGAISRVTVPLMLPSFVAIGTWQFLWTWNEYMFAVTLTTGWEKAPITVGMGDYSDSW